MQRVLFGDTSVVNLCISACVKAGNDSLKMGWRKHGKSDLNMAVKMKKYGNKA